MQRLLIIFCLVCTQRLCAQTTSTATGSWFGRADVDIAGMHNNYLTELVIKQKGNRIEGIFGYYFRDKYQSFFVRGRYDPKTRQVIIQNIPIIYYNSNSTVNSIDCNTNFIGVIINSKVQSTLKGAFYRDEKYKYLCPDLKVSYTLDRADQQHDSLQDMKASNGRIWRPQEDDFVVDAVKTDQAATQKNTSPASATTANTAPQTNTAPPADTPSILTATPARLSDSSLARTTTSIKPIAADTAILRTASIADPAKEDSKKIAESFSKRKESVTRILDVESDSVRLSFYDNGEIDGDSISVFVNGQVVLTHQELASRALTMYLHLDSDVDVNEVSMFAENLGKYPPNTALMVVTDGKNRYEIFMSSSLTENATIRFRRKKGPSQ